MSLHWRSPSIYLAILLSPGWNAGQLAAAQDDEDFEELSRVNVVKALIVRALGETTELEFVNVPLKDAVKVLSARHDADIQFDEDALAAAGVRTETPITMHLRGITLPAALRLMLTDLDLTFVLQDYRLLITTNAAAAVAVDDPPPRLDPVNDRVNRALGEGTEMEFIDTPLKDVLDVIGVRHDIEVRVDEDALADAGINSDVTVTKTLKGISFRSALELILGDLDLAFAARDGTLWITTMAAAEGPVSTEPDPAVENPPDVAPPAGPTCCRPATRSKSCRQPRRCRSATRSRRCRR